MICRCGTGLAASAFDLLTLRRISLEEKEEKEEEEGWWLGGGGEGTEGDERIVADGRKLDCSTPATAARNTRRSFACSCCVWYFWGN